MTKDLVVRFDWEEIIANNNFGWICSCISFKEHRIMHNYLKSYSHLPNSFFICFNDSPSKLMKNAFYFILTALFAFKIFKFLSWLFRHVEKWLHQRDNVSFKTNDVTAWLEKVQYTCCSISLLIKGNKTMKFG